MIVCFVQELPLAVNSAAWQHDRMTGRSARRWGGSGSGSSPCWRPSKWPGP